MRVHRKGTKQKYRPASLEMVTWSGTDGGGRLQRTSKGILFFVPVMQLAVAVF